MAATALPSSGSPAPTEAVGCDTSDMFVIHGLIRSLYRDAPGLAAGVADGDTVRSEIVGAHLDEISVALHHHHRTENALLWDQLEAAAPTCTPHVERMRLQHERLGQAVDQLQAALPAWRASGSTQDAAAVSAGIDAVIAGLNLHLGDEETNILPVAAAAMTQAAWDKIGEAGRAAVPRDRLFIQLGFILASLPDDQREKWKKEFLPAPARAMYALFGRRQYEKHRALVYGTAA